MMIIMLMVMPVIKMTRTKMAMKMMINAVCKRCYTYLSPR